MIRSDRFYWPSDYVDEISPEPRAHPTAWIERDPDGSLHLAPDMSAGPSVRKRRPLKDGDEIGFSWSEDRPDVRVTFHADGTYTVHGQDAAPDANNFWDPDEHENSGESLKFLAELTLDPYTRGQFELEEEMTISCNVWEVETWRLFVTATDFRFERAWVPLTREPQVEQGSLPL